MRRRYDILDDEFDYIDDIDFDDESERIIDGEIDELLDILNETQDEQDEPIEQPSKTEHFNLEQLSEAFRLWVALARENRKLSTAELAEKTLDYMGGLSRTAIEKIEAGWRRNKPMIDELTILALALRMKPSEILQSLLTISVRKYPSTSTEEMKKDLLLVCQQLIRSWR